MGYVNLPMKLVNMTCSMNSVNWWHAESLKGVLKIHREKYFILSTLQYSPACFFFILNGVNIYQLCNIFAFLAPWWAGHYDNCIILLCLQYCTGTCVLFLLYLSQCLHSQPAWANPFVEQCDVLFWWLYPKQKYFPIWVCMC